MPRGSIGIVLELVRVQRSTGRGSAIVVTIEVVRVHHGGAILVPEGVCRAHISDVVPAVLLSTAIESQVLNCTSRPALMR